MKPDANALQVFYGTLPLMLVIVAGFIRSQMTLKDILKRLHSIEQWLIKAAGRLVALETRAGMIFSK